MAQQQPQLIDPDPTQFDLDQMFRDEDAGMLPQDAADQLKRWRAAGVLPQRTPSVPTPPLSSDVGGAMTPAKTGRFLTDPNQVLPTVGGIAGGAAAGVATGGNPLAVRAGTGLGAAAGTYGAKAIEQKTLLPKNVALPALGQAVLGAAMPTGRIAGKLLSGQSPVKKLPLTPIGKDTVDLLGEQSLPSDLVESPGLDFMRNVATEGFGGRKGMLQHEAQMSGTLKDKLVGEADTLLNAPGIPASPKALSMERGEAGKKVKDTLAKNYQQQKGEASQMYNPFLEKYGDAAVVDAEGMTGMPFKQLHQARSAVLRQGRMLQASGNPDPKALAANRAMRHQIEDQMEQTIGSRAKAEYDAISGQYRDVMDIHENDFVHWLREGDATPAEKILDVFDNPDRLKTFAPDRGIKLSGGKRGAPTLPAGQTISQEDAIHLFRDAVGEDAFQQFRADSLFHLAKDKSKKLTSGAEILDGHGIVESLQKMPPGVQRALYGPNATERINKIARVAEHVQRARQGSGSLWIVMRQPSAVLGLGSAAAAGMTGGGIPGLAVATGGTILLGPKVFSAILRNPKSLDLFTQAAGAAAPNIKQRLVQELSAQLIRTGALGAAEHTIEGQDDMSAVMPGGNPLQPAGLTIPPPPQSTP